jgi:DNA-binding response OmpR family regulator
MFTCSVLIVDDDPIHRALLGVLINPKTYRPIMACNGEEALHILEHETPSLIIIDLAMPRVDGVQVLKSVRADSRFVGTKIMVVTAIPGRLSPSEIGLVDKVVTKPFLISEVKENIRSLLGTAGAPVIGCSTD